METVEITVERLEKFIEAEVKLGIIKKELEQEGLVYTSHLQRLLGVEATADNED